MTMINAFEAGRAALEAEERALIERRARLLGPAYRLFYEHPVHLVRGAGVWLYDAAGRAYLDVYNNVPGVGHCHPHVVEAIARQAAVLNTHTRYLHEGILDYAEALLGTLPAHLAHVMFTCSGSEANDLAYRIALRATGGTGFIVTELAYHGCTKVIAELSPSLGVAAGLGRDVRTVRAPDSYRCAPAELGRRLADDVRAALADFARSGVRPAAFIVDSIFSSDGVFADPPGFLAEAIDVVRAAGALFIADEVQAGFGRTGDALWGFERHGVAPDIVTLGKPMGAGHPVAGVAVRPEVVAEFAATRYFNTFGGNPVSAAAGRAVLEVIERERLVDNARQVGEYLQSGLRALATRHESIGDVRGAGLFIGMELVSDRARRTPDATLTARVVNALRERRILLSASGPGGNVLKIRPPLVFAREHADLLLGALDEVLGEAQR